MRSVSCPWIVGQRSRELKCEVIGSHSEMRSGCSTGDWGWRQGCSAAANRREMLAWALSSTQYTWSAFQLELVTLIRRRCSSKGM